MFSLKNHLLFDVFASFLSYVDSDEVFRSAYMNKWYVVDLVNDNLTRHVDFLYSVHVVCLYH